MDKKKVKIFGENRPRMVNSVPNRLNIILDFNRSTIKKKEMIKMKRKKKMENVWEKTYKEDVLNELKNLFKRENTLKVMVTTK